MRNSWLFKRMAAPITLFMAVMLVVMPMQTTFAQDTATACADAERQAESDVSAGTWFAFGCFLGILVYLIGLQPENPPAANLLGKPPEYVAAYTDCYRAKTKDIKSKNALTGCLVGAGVQVLLYAIIIAAADDGDEF